MKGKEESATFLMVTSTQSLTYGRRALRVAIEKVLDTSILSTTSSMAVVLRRGGSCACSRNSDGTLQPTPSLLPFRRTQSLQKRLSATATRSHVTACGGWILGTIPSRKIKSTSKRPSCLLKRYQARCPWVLTLDEVAPRRTCSQASVCQRVMWRLLTYIQTHAMPRSVEECWSRVPLVLRSI